MQIKFEKDYLKTLAEIKKLFHAKPNTPQGDRLEILTMLVESYEEKYHKIAFPDPMDAIHYSIESRQIERKLKKI